MRTPEVTLNFTPNALASVLYKQGDTVILLLHQGSPPPGWFPETPPKVGCTLNIRFSPVPPIHASVESDEERKVGRRKLTPDRSFTSSGRGPRSAWPDCPQRGLRCPQRRRWNPMRPLRQRTSPSFGRATAHRSGRLPPLRPPSNTRTTQGRMDATNAGCHGTGTPRERRSANDLAAVSVGLIDGEVYLDLDYVWIQMLMWT